MRILLSPPPKLPQPKEASDMALWLETWLLLMIAFALGLLVGWVIWHRQ